MVCVDDIIIYDIIKDFNQNILKLSTIIKNNKNIIDEKYLLTPNNKQLYIFDLDDTLYLRTMRGYCDIDEFHKYIKDIIFKLYKSGKILCIASHNKNVKYCLEKLDILDLFTYIIGEYPRSKKTMVLEILDNMKITSDQAVFFDDLIKNIKDVSELGVESHWLKYNLGILEKLI
jgi:HAD superfamily phosphatase (TIGR01681 family)